MNILSETKPTDSLVITVTIEGDSIQVATSEPIRYLDCLNALVAAYKAVYITATENAEKGVDNTTAPVVH